jgi:dynein heavy chain
MLKDFLPDLNRKLEDCQKSLEAYLEGKRKKFPRFYFVSNPTLLKILSQGSEPTSIQEDFEKLFDAITKVTFERNTEKKGANEKMITSIQQVLGRFEENVRLEGHYVKCEGNIEGWLKTLETNMQVSLKEIAKKASTKVFSMELRPFIQSQVS